MTVLAQDISVLTFVYVVFPVIVCRTEGRSTMPLRLCQAFLFSSPRCTRNLIGLRQREEFDWLAKFSRISRSCDTVSVASQSTAILGDIGWFIGHADTYNLHEFDKWFKMVCNTYLRSSIKMLT